VKNTVFSQNVDAEIGTAIEALDTPALIVDLALVEANIQAMMQRIKKFPGVSVRPHLKTGKCPEIARLMLDAGAAGICVAKISEAEVFTDAGIRDILITSEFAGMPKLDRFFRLYQRNSDLKIVLDNADLARQLNSLATNKSVSQPIKVLIDLNVGQNRTGVNTASEALDLARVIAALPHLQLIGIQGYEGHLQHLPDSDREQQCRQAMSKLNEAVQHLRKNEFGVPVVTTGGTGTAEVCAGCESVTELQPGSFVFMDVAYRDATGGKFANALSVLSTVTSSSCPERAVIDAGMKSLSIDMGNAEPKNLAGLTYRPAGDEYGIVESKSGPVPLSVGDKLELIPGHIDTTVALFDEYMVVQDGKLAAIWRISARGKVQ
jgi:D-serine deaminase-like pyridoxal phosphate-dependent protein